MSEHPWSTNPAAQAAIRRAEDGRSEPGPGLAEGIERQREAMAHKGREMSEGLRTERVQITEGETLANVRDDQGGRRLPKGPPPALHPSLSSRPAETDGMRTERVTLEIVDGRDFSVTMQAVPALVADYLGVKRKSVRVVPSSESDAEIERLRGDVRDLRLNVNWTEAERLCAIRERDEARARVAELEAAVTKHHPESPATEQTSQGVEPVAWMVVAPIGRILPLCHSKQQAEEIAAKLTSPSTVVPIYRAPQPILTAEEREAVAFAARHCQFHEDQEILGALLARAGGG